MESRAPECDQSEVADALLRIKIHKIKEHDAVVECAVPGCALEPEFTDRASSLLCLRQSTKVTPESVVHHLKHSGVHTFQRRVLLFQRDDPRLHPSHRRSDPDLSCGSALFEEFIVEPPTGIECGIQSRLSGCIWIRSILVGNKHRQRESSSER